MEIDWDKVKEWTLWHYEELIKKISTVFEYSFIRETCNHSMNEARAYSAGILGFGEGKYDDYLKKLTRTYESLEKHRIKDNMHLIEEIETREKCEKFLTRTKIPFRELIRLLNHLFRWILPFIVPIKEFLDKDNEEHMIYAKKLREIGIKCNLDLLEEGRNFVGRNQIAAQTLISEQFLRELVDMADISRIPYIRGKTVKIFCNVGYGTLQKIADASIDTFTADLKEYLRTLDVKFSKSFIEPDGAIAQAKALPKLVFK